MRSETEIRERLAKAEKTFAAMPEKTKTDAVHQSYSAFTGALEWVLDDPEKEEVVDAGESP